MNTRLIVLFLPLHGAHLPRSARPVRVGINLVGAPGAGDGSISDSKNISSDLDSFKRGVSPEFPMLPVLLPT